MSARCTYLDQYLKPGTRVHAQWYRGTHKCNWVWIKNKLARKPQRQKANGRHGKTFYNTLRTLGAHNLHSLTTLQVRVDTRNIVREHLERQRTCSPRESLYVFTSWLPRESSYVSTSRIVVRVYLENNFESRPEWGRKCYQKLKSHRKARDSNYKVTTLQCCQHCLIKKLKSHRKARDSNHKVTTLQCCQHCQVETRTI